MFDHFYQAMNAYRKIAHPDIEIGRPYSLVPEQASDDVKLRWPKDEWENSKSAGVYVIFSSDETTLYVGKAWFLGQRLADHFRKDAKGACVSPANYIWSKLPMYVITIAVPSDKRFVASCLEEYLIEKLQPLDNTIGVHELVVAD